MNKRDRWIYLSPERTGGRAQIRSLDGTIAYPNTTDPVQCSLLATAPELRAALDAMYAAFHRSPSSHEEQERAMNQAWELLARTAAED